MAAKATPSRRPPARETLKRVRWGEAIIAGIVGYLAPSAVNKTGIPQAVYQAVPQWAALLDKLPSDVAANYGLNLVAKGGGAAGLLKWGHDYVKTGRISDGKLNAGMPFAIGMLLDDVGSPSGSFSGSGGVSW
jgi:hypothetical protein